MLKDNELNTCKKYSCIWINKTLERNR